MLAAITARSAFVGIFSTLLLLGCGQPAERTEPGAGPESWAAGEVETQVAEILARQDRIARTGGLANLLQDLPPRFLDEVLAGFDGAFLEWGDNEPVLLAEWWTRFDPLAAKRWSESDWRADHPRVALTVMRAMARTDPQMALQTYFDEYSGLRPEASQYPGGLEAIVIGWYESGQDGLLDFIKGQPIPELRQQTMGTLARLVVLDLGGQGAIEWTEARIAEDGSEIFARQIQQRIAAAIAEDDPALASAWVERLIAQGAHGSLPRRVATRWAKQNPEAALLWLESFEDNAHRHQAIAESWNVFWRKDPQRAHAWVREQGDKTYGFLGPALARSIKQQVTLEKKAGLPTDYEAYLAESIRIEDPEVRWGSVTFVARFWRLEDEAAAEAWMVEHDVPENFRFKVRGPLPGGLRNLGES